MEPSSDSKKTLWYVLGGIALLVLLVFGLERLASQDSRYSSDSEAPSAAAEDTKFKGPADASVTLIEYSDFQCPACANVAPLVGEISKEFPDDLKVVYRYFPLTRIHPNAFVSARAAEAAHLQGKFWEMHDILFSRQKDWAEQKDPSDTFRAYAKEIGLDMDRFEKDLSESATSDAVKRDQALGTKADIPGTPTFFLNGERISPRDMEDFKRMVRDAIEKSKASDGSGQAGSNEEEPETNN